MHPFEEICEFWTARTKARASSDKATKDQQQIHVKKFNKGVIKR